MSGERCDHEGGDGCELHGCRELGECWKFGVVLLGGRSGVIDERAGASRTSGASYVQVIPEISSLQAVAFDQSWSWETSALLHSRSCLALKFASCTHKIAIH